MQEDHDETEERLALKNRLEEALTKARQRLWSHDEYLSEDETRTRVVVIDEVLKGLGWDVTDPEQVRLEHRDNGNKIDYVLKTKESRFLAVVEAKRSKEGPSDAHRRQASGYALELGTKYAVLTNGGRWEAWQVVPEKPRRETMIAEVNITTGDIDQIASQLMSLHCVVLGTEGRERK